MRAYIKRTEECKALLAEVHTEEDAYFDQDDWLNNSNESFHGIISDTRDSFIFKDARLPCFELPLQFVEIDE